VIAAVADIQGEALRVLEGGGERVIDPLPVDVLEGRILLLGVLVTLIVGLRRDVAVSVLDPRIVILMTPVEVCVRDCLGVALVDEVEVPVLELKGLVLTVVVPFIV